MWSFGGRRIAVLQVRTEDFYIHRRCADAQAMSVLSGILERKISWFSFPGAIRATPALTTATPVGSDTPASVLTGQ